MNPNIIQKTQLLFGCLGEFLGGIFFLGRCILGCLKLFLFIFGLAIVFRIPINTNIKNLYGVSFYINEELIQLKKFGRLLD